MSFTLLTAAVEVTADGSKAAQQAAQDIEGSPLAEKAGSGFGKKLVAGIGAAVAAVGIGKLISDGMDIQAGNAKLAAGLNLTKSQAQNAGKAAGTLFSSNYGDSMEDVQTSVGEAISSIDSLRGANASTVADVTKRLINIRTAFGVDVGESAQAAGELVKTGMAKNVNEATDLITSGLQRVPAALRGDLLDAVNEYQPSFKMIGASGTEMFDVLTAASKGGAIQLDKAGDAVKEFGIRVTDTTDANAGPALKRLGLDQKQLADDMLAGGQRGQDAMQKIVAGLLAVKDPSKQAALTAALFGTQIEDIGKGKIPGFLQGLAGMDQGQTKVAGSAARLDTTLNATAANSVQSISRGFQGWTNDLVANSGALGGIAVVAGTVAGPLLSMGGALALIVPALQNMGIVTKIAAAGQWLLNAAMSANPIGIIIVAVAALVAALVWFFTQTSLGRQIWAGFVSWLQAVIAGFAGWWNGVWAGISSFVAGVWNGIVSFVRGAVNLVANVIKLEILGAQIVWNAVTNAIRSVAMAVWNAIVGFITGVVNTIANVIKLEIRGAQIVWSAVTNTISSVARAVWAGIVGFISGYVNTVRSVIEAAIRGAQIVWSAVTNTIGSVARSVWGGISSFIGGVVNTIRSAITSAINTARSVWESGVNVIRSATSSAFNAAVGAVRSAVGTIGNIVGGIRSTVQGALAGAGEWLVGAGRNIVQGLINGIRAMIGAVGSAISSIVNFIKDHLPHSPAKVGPMSGSGWRAVGDAGSSIVEEVASGFDRQVRRTSLTMPGVDVGGSTIGAVRPNVAGATNSGNGAPAFTLGGTGDTFQVTLNVRMDEVDDVRKLVDMVRSIPQAARTGRSTVTAS